MFAIVGYNSRLKQQMHLKGGFPVMASTEFHNIAVNSGLNTDKLLRHENQSVSLAFAKHLLLQPEAASEHRLNSL